MLVVTVFWKQGERVLHFNWHNVRPSEKNISYEMRYDMIREIIMLNFSPRFPYGIKLSTPTWERLDWLK